MNLQEHGIQIRSNSAGDYKTICPQCSHTRKNKRDTCLSVTIQPDGSSVWKCHHCEWTGSTKSPDATFRQQYVQAPREIKKPKPKTVNEKGYGERIDIWFNKRAISKVTWMAFGIYETLEQTPKIAFPYLLDGELVNVKYRSYDKRFTQEPKAQRTLFNIDRVKTRWDGGKSKTVIFVEGEMDVLAMYEAGYDYAISLPDGAPQQTKFDPNDRRFEAFQSSDWLNDADRVIIAVDTDSAGNNLAQELAHRFGKHRCWRVQFPNIHDIDCKDANETLMIHGKEVLAECVVGATPYPIDGLYKVSDYIDQVFNIYEGNFQRPVSTGYANLDKIYQVMPGTFQLVTGIPNHGKSNFLDQLILNLAEKHNWKFAIFSPEHSTSFHIRRLVEKVCRSPFDEGINQRMSKDELRRGLDYLQTRFFFIENKEVIPTIDWVLEKATAACVRHGINGVVVDPFNKISATRASSVREDEHIRDSIAKCQKFCQSHNVTFWMVAHPHKLHRGESGSYNAPSLYEVAGSAHWNNMADVGMVVHRDFDAGTTRVIMRKIREQGMYGQIGEAVFRYNTLRRVYEENEADRSQPHWSDD